MSAFDEIARDAPSSATLDIPGTYLDVFSSDDNGDSTDLYGALRRVARLVFHRNNHTAFGKLLRLCVDEVCRATVLELKGEDAQVVLDGIQLVSFRYRTMQPGKLDETNTLSQQALDKLHIGGGFLRHALYVLVKLSANSDKLPSSLFVHGVQLPDRDRVGGGGFADVYKGCFRGEDVAIKRLRVDVDGDRTRLHKVRC
jgi:hypothetical protein